jgi:anti-sigma factor RsiW
VNDCREVRRVLPRFVDLALDDSGEAEVRRHLAACAECRAALAVIEPAAALAVRLGSIASEGDASFVGEVMAGVHQRKLERRLTHHRRGWLAAAAGLVLAILGGWTVLHEGSAPAPQSAAVAPVRRAPAAAEPAFVEVEGAGVRLYQLDTAAQGAVKVAFVVDPHLEL